MAVREIRRIWRKSNEFTLYRGNCIDLLRKLDDASVDLVLTSPPYCIGKSYENETSADDFEKNHDKVLPEIVRITKNGGSICWQIGYHVQNGVVTPLDFIVYKILSKYPEIHLRNRIIWTFGHGLHTSERFSGRHEVILWFTKGETYSFNLDAVRVPQKYPGKKAYKGEKRGEFSGNPLGKNPSDVWDIPNIKARHIEKTEHPCQFPVALAQRVIKALTRPGDIVCDPYSGSGTTGAAAALLSRRFVGAELSNRYFDVARRRINSAMRGQLSFRPENMPVYTPPANTSLTTVPLGWRKGEDDKEISMHSA